VSFICMMTSFLLTLPSSSSTNVFPGNAISDFRVRLADHINLPRERYEVALMQLSYIHSVNTFAEEQDCCISYSNDEKKGTVKLPNVCYSSIEHLLNVMDRELRSIDDNTRKHAFLFYDSYTNRITLKSHMLTLKFSEALSAILGFEPIEFQKSHVYHTTFSPDIRAGMHSMFIYCDLVEHQFVGDKKAPLLRELPLLGEEGKPVVQSFALPFYVPLHVSSLDTVHIRVADESGHNIPFQKGPLTVTLQIRSS